MTDTTLRAAVDKLLADSLPVILAADAVLQENAALRARVAELEFAVQSAAHRIVFGDYASHASFAAIDGALKACRASVETNSTAAGECAERSET